MRRLEKLNFYEILDVSPDADQAEIHEAYERAKRTYSRNSIAVYSLLEEREIEALSALIEKAYETIGNERGRREYDRTLGGTLKGRKETLGRTEDAYLRWMNASLHPNKRAGVDMEGRKEVEAMISQPDFYCTGANLKKLRETLELDLKEISMRTKVSRMNLEFIEAEDFSHLPALVYLKGFITEYAKCLGLDPFRVSTDYMKRYHQWQRDKEKA